MVVLWRVLRISVCRFRISLRRSLVESPARTPAGSFLIIASSRHSFDTMQLTQIARAGFTDSPRFGKKIDQFEPAHEAYERQSEISTLESTKNLYPL